MIKANETQARFRFGDVFPQDSVLARWIILLALILEDLLFLNDLANEGEGTGSEEMWFLESVYLSITRVREAAKVLERGVTSREIADFLKETPFENQRRFQELTKTFTPWKGSMVEGAVRYVRNSYVH